MAVAVPPSSTNSPVEWTTTLRPPDHPATTRRHRSYGRYPTFGPGVPDLRTPAVTTVRESSSEHDRSSTIVRARSSEHGHPSTSGPPSFELDVVARGPHLAARHRPRSRGRLRHPVPDPSSRHHRPSRRGSVQPCGPLQPCDPLRPCGSFRLQPAGFVPTGGVTHPVRCSCGSATNSRPGPPDPAPGAVRRRCGVSVVLASDQVAVGGPAGEFPTVGELEFA